MCLGCLASTEFWDLAGEDRQPQSPEELDLRQSDVMRDRLRAGLARLEEDLSAGRPPVRSTASEA